MRKIILSVAVSLDGLIEGPAGEYDWCLTDQDYGISDLIKRIDTLFIGRKTYELMQRVGNNTGFPPMKEYIFSTTLTSVKEDAILISGNAEERVKEIKQEKGRDIWLFGGAGLTTSLLNAGLVDEIILAVHPLVLGSGKPLFQNIKQRTPLTLLSSQSWSTGLITMNYAVNNVRADQK